MRDARAVWLTMLVMILAAPRLRAERVIVVAGRGATLTNRASPAGRMPLHAPFGLDFDAIGNLYIVEMEGGERVWRMDPQQVLTVIAGTGQKGDRGDGGPALEAQFNGMHSLASDPAGNLFIADTWNSRVRRIEAGTRKVFAFAGTGRKGFSGDGGPALAAEFGNIYSVAFDSSRQKLYLADLDNRRIRVVNLRTGVVTTVAGNGDKGIPADGAPATQSPLVDPRAVAVDAQDNLYILERSGHALRRVDRSGAIRTVAGTGQRGFAGDGGAALSASFNEPKHLCVDQAGNVIIADTDNHVIRKFLVKENRVIPIAGSGKSGSSVAGPLTALEMNQPHGVCLDKAGMLYIADSLNDRVLKIVP